jgi:hypothetical protein
MPWVDNRENELLGIMASLVPLKTGGTIVTLDRNPVGKLLQEQMDAVLLFEGPDQITKNPPRGTLGPQQRALSLIFELWVYNNSDDISARNRQLRSLYNEVRKAAMLKRALSEVNLTSVFTSSVPGVVGVGLVMELKYVNNGN